MAPTLPHAVIRSKLEFRSRRATTGPLLNGVRCLEWTGAKHDQGYGRVWTGTGLDYAHRMAWLVFVGPLPRGKDVLHCCDNPPCIEPRHLWCGTHQQNMADRDAKGRTRNGGDKMRGRPSPLRGRRHPKSILYSREQARAIFVDTRVARVIGLDYNISGSSVRAIKHGRLWGWATVDLRAAVRSE